MLPTQISVCILVNGSFTVEKHGNYRALEVLGGQLIS